MSFSEEKMAPISELEMRILSELEELHFENIPAMMNTVMEPAGEPNELTDMQEALRGLVMAELATMCSGRDSEGRLKGLSKDESLASIVNLDSTLRFDATRKLWTNSRRTGPPFRETFPFVLNTKTGKEKGFEILQERGYQWWRPKK
jgi:hypothetical protein